MKPLTFNAIDCSTGNCHVSPAIWANAKVNVGDLQVQDSSHPNVMPFTGTLLLLNVPSTQPPHGADGHLIRVDTETARKRLNTLPGMAINYQTDLTGHNPSKKIGVITEAWIQADKVRVKGVIWKKDFPEAARLFKEYRGQLGMSMELGDVYVKEKDARIWDLADFHFTGATVLLRDHAAYGGTDLAASKYFVKALAAAADARGIFRKGGLSAMADKNKKESKSGQSSKQKLVALISASVEKGVGSSVAALLKEQEKNNKILATAIGRLADGQAELTKGLHALVINAAAGEEVEEDDDTEDIEANASDASMDADASMSDASMSMSKKMAAKKADATDSTDDDGSDGSMMDDDDGSIEADGSGTEDLDPTNYDASEQGDEGSGSTPGDLNKNASPNSKRNARSGAGAAAKKAGGKKISRGSLAASGGAVGNISAAARVIRTLRAQNQKQSEDIKKLRSRVTSMEASIDRYADRVERKSITPEVSALLEKQGWDVRELMASKTRLSVNEVDEMLAKSGIPLDPTMRASFKNQLLQAGLMEQGQINRFAN